MTKSIIIPPFLPTSNIERVALMVIVAVGVVGLTFGKPRCDRMIL